MSEEELGIDSLDPVRHPTAHRLLQQYDSDGLAVIESLKARVAEDGGLDPQVAIETMVVPMIVDLWRAVIEVAANLDEVANAAGIRPD